MNEDHSDEILEAFLEEMLGGNHPPDLTQRIKTAWMAENLRANAGDEEGVAEVIELPDPATTRNKVLAEVVDTSPLSHEAGSIASGSASISGEQLSPKGATAIGASDQDAIEGRRKPPKRSSNTKFLAAVAASLLVLAAWTVLPDGIFEGTTAAKKDDAAPINTQSPFDSSDTSPKLALDDDDGTDRLDKVSGEVIDIDDLPFPNPDTDVAVHSPEPPKANEEAGLNGSEIVSSLNEQLDALWSDLGVEPAEPLGNAAFAQKVASILQGQNTAATTDLPRNELVAQAVESSEFSRQFSDRTLSAWLRRSDIDLQGKEAQQLRQLLRERVESSKPWNDVVVDLLGGDLSDGTPSAIFVSALSGGGNRRLAERVGAHFLNANFACVRCHDAMSAESADPDSIATQETYWSTVAMLSGINATGSNRSGQRELLDRQQSLLQRGFFAEYELLDHRMKSAQARLPDGSDWSKVSDSEVPRVALANWIASSKRMDESTVNHLWSELVGRPLVPQVVDVESIGIEPRRKMLSMLAEQYRLHGRDIKDLAKWIASSDAFARKPVSLSRDQWLLASEEDLERLQLAELVFALGPSQRNSDSISLANTLAVALKQKQSGSLSDNTTLGQRNQPQNPKRPRPSRITEQTTMPRLDYAIHGERFTPAQKRYVRRVLSADELSWADHVGHIVRLGSPGAGGGRVQQLTDELLKKHSGNEEATLLDLLWAVEATGTL